MKRIIPLLMIIVAACSTTPVSITDLEPQNYTDTEMVMVQLDCTSVITAFHLGLGWPPSRTPSWPDRMRTQW